VVLLVCPKILCKSVERIKISERLFQRVDPRLLFISSTQVLTDLSGALHRSDRCDPCWVLFRVNILVCWFVFGLASISSLVLFGGMEL
jgi:hypothetical protein